MRPDFFRHDIETAGDMSNLYKCHGDLRDGRGNLEAAVSQWRADAAWFHAHQCTLVEKFRAI